MISRKKKKTSFWGPVLGLMISLLIIGLYLAHPRVLEVIELKLFDLKFRWGKQRSPGSEVIIAAIDQKSIDELGRWPWSRNKMEDLIETLTEAGAEIIAFDITFPSPEKNLLIEYIKEYHSSSTQTQNNDPDQIQNQTQDQSKNQTQDQSKNQTQDQSKNQTQDQSKNQTQDQNLIQTTTDNETSVRKVDPEQLQEILQALSTQINPDQDLSNAIQKAGNVILGMFYFLSPEEAQKRGKKESKKQKQALILPEPPFLSSQRYQLIQRLDSDPQASSSSSRIAKGYGFEASMDILAEAAMSNGFFNMYPDFDGVIRWSPLIIEYKDNFYPSLDMQVIKHYWDLKPDSILIQIGKYGVESMYIENVPIPVDERGNLLINYLGKEGAFPHYSIADILAHRIPVENLQSKIVLVGATATGIYDMRYTPYNIMSGVEIHANIINNFLNLDFLSLPGNYFLIELFILLGIGLLLGIILSYTRPLTGLISTAVLIIGYAGINQYLFSYQGIWINTIYPLVEIMAIFTAINLYRYATEEKEKRKIKNSFEHYLAPDLVQELIQNPDMLKLGGEKKVLTVLFSDIRGFTSISERLTPESLISFLNEYMSTMSTLILNNFGFLDKFIGDAIMAVYCAPIFRLDHAVLACQTALEMRAALTEINQKCLEQDLPEIKIGIGINSGEMVIGNMGSSQRLDYTVLGDNVNLASRLEGITKVYGVSIVMSEYTYKLVQGRFLVRELDLVRVKGKTQPVKIYELVSKIEDTPQFEAIINHYLEGLKAYRNRQWDLGLVQFQEVLHLDPSDGPAKYYLERCREYLDKPPSINWDGVSTFQTK